MGSCQPSRHLHPAEATTPKAPPRPQANPDAPPSPQDPAEIVRITDITDGEVEDTFVRLEELHLLTEQLVPVHDSPELKMWRDSRTKTTEFVCEASAQGVAAQALHEVLTDTEARLSWDESTLDYRVLRRNRLAGECDYEEWVYWVLGHGWFMQNRDYVIQRRVVHRPDRLLVISRTIELPDHPERRGHVRVTQYRSAQVLTSHRAGFALEEPSAGLLLRCQYSEDHQIELPDAVCNVAFQERYPKVFGLTIAAARQRQLLHSIRAPVGPRLKLEADKPQAANFVDAIVDKTEEIIAECAADTAPRASRLCCGC